MSHEHDSQPTTAIDPREWRDVMGHYPTGVVVVSAIVNGAPVGMVVGTFSSVSIDPALVSFMPMKTSNSYAALREAEGICISVFAHDQLQACRVLASKDPEKFSKVAWSAGSNGAPKIHDAVAHIEGRITQEIEAGDHYITLVSVDELAVARATTPLLFFQGGYGGFSATGLSAWLDESFISAARVAEAARPQLDALAKQLNATAAALVQISALDQTIGASSYPTNSEVDERIGVRIPLIPPLGEAAVAWDDDQIEQWVTRIWPIDEQTKQKYRDAAARVREQGYAVSRTDVTENGAAKYTEVGEALAEWATGELTPARDRAVRGVINSGDECFGGSIRAEESEVNLVSVVVPVFDPTSEQPRNSGLVLRLSGLPQSVPGQTALEWVAQLQQAAQQVRETLASSAASHYQRYVSQGLRNS